MTEARSNNDKVRVSILNYQTRAMPMRLKVLERGWWRAGSERGGLWETDEKEMDHGEENLNQR
jgi:hypothetical protein